jgi:hypothetical protein
LGPRPYPQIGPKSNDPPFRYRAVEKHIGNIHPESKSKPEARNPKQTKTAEIQKSKFKTGLFGILAL